MKPIIFVLAALFAQTALCQTADNTMTVSAILNDIKQNNLQLRSMKQRQMADVEELKSEIGIGETSIEYSPFYQRGLNGMSSSELIVSQEFDFPSVYSRKKKSINLQQQAMEKELLVEERNIMLEARQVCYDLLLAFAQDDMLGRRLAVADSMLAICDKRMQNGSCTVMEMNRAKIDRMNVLTEKMQNATNVKTLKLALERMGAQGDALLSVNSLVDDENLSLPQGISADVEESKAALAVASQNVALTRTQWFPRLNVGYRRNTAWSEPSQNGVLVGVALPIFTNTRKMKAARMYEQAAEQELQRTTTEMENRRRQLKMEASEKKLLLESYDQTLMQQTLDTLLRAVNAGELPILEYYTEADRVYSLMQQRLEVENAYRKLMAEIWAY